MNKAKDRMGITNWRKSEFDYLKNMMFINQLNNKIELYNKYLDVLNHKEIKELKKLEKEKSLLIVIGKPGKLK